MPRPKRKSRSLDIIEELSPRQEQFQNDAQLKILSGLMPKTPEAVGYAGFGPYLNGAASTAAVILGALAQGYDIDAIVRLWCVWCVATTGSAGI